MKRLLFERPVRSNSLHQLLAKTGAAAIDAAPEAVLATSSSHECCNSTFASLYPSSSPLNVLRRWVEFTQYTSIAFGNRCRELGVTLSMGSVGDCFDNAMAESFFATLECELLDRFTFKTHAEAQVVIFDFIEGWYNSQRRHSSLGHLSPLQYEAHYANYS